MAITDVQEIPLAVDPAPPGQSRKIVVMPEAGIDPILNAIEASKTRLYVKMFELAKPKIIKAIIAAHQRGVETHVQLNRIRTDGSFMNLRSIDLLRRAQVPVKWCSPRFEVTHEKSMVIDDQAFICSFNFCGKFFKRVRGYAVVTTVTSDIDEILLCFKADWARKELPKGETLLWGGHETRTRILSLLDSAQKTLDIQHKKLVDACVLERLLDAATRGVRIRFLCSAEKGVHGGDLYENAACIRILRTHGVEVHHIARPKIHAKLILVDGVRAKVGSVNLAVACFEKRRELAIMLEEPREIATLMATFELDWGNSEPWMPADPKIIEDDLEEEEEEG